MSSLTDDFDFEAALAACVKGERGALHRIYQLEGGRLLGVALRIVRRRDIAEDDGASQLADLRAVMQDPLFTNAQTDLSQMRAALVHSPGLVQSFLTPAGRELEHAVARIQGEVACQAGLPEEAFTALCSTLHELTQRMADDPKVKRVAA